MQMFNFCLWSLDEESFVVIALQSSLDILQDFHDGSCGDMGGRNAIPLRYQNIFMGAGRTFCDVRILES
jgi:hypothetical protein